MTEQNLGEHFKNLMPTPEDIKIVCPICNKDLTSLGPGDAFHIAPIIHTRARNEEEAFGYTLLFYCSNHSFEEVTLAYTVESLERFTKASTQFKEKEKLDDVVKFDN